MLVDRHGHRFRHFDVLGDGNTVNVIVPAIEREPLATVVTAMTAFESTAGRGEIVTAVITAG